MLNAQNSSIAKKLFISQLSKQIKLCLCLFLFNKKKKEKKPQKMLSCFCLRHGAYLDNTSNVLAYLLIIFFLRKRLVWVFLK